MKKIISILFVALSLFSYSQVTVNVWRITPDTVCPGDSVKIDYKAQWPNTPDLSTNNFYLTPIGNSIWSGNWSILKNRPKEHYAGLPVGDSAYWIKVRIPLSTTQGTYVINGNGTGTANITPFYVKNCSCTVTANFTHTNNLGVYTFSSTSIGTNSNTTYNWDFGQGAGWNQYPSSVSYTYSTAGNYTVGLLVTNPTCTDVVYLPISVTLTTNTTGLTEQQREALKPVYFDFYGNIAEPVKGVLLIEQVGNRRRKVIIQ